MELIHLTYELLEEMVNDLFTKGEEVSDTNREIYETPYGTISAKLNKFDELCCN